MLNRVVIVWIVYAGVMGFAVGGSLVAAYQIPLSQHESSTNPEQNPSDQNSKEKSDEALARYTLWLTVFTGVMAFATVGLGIATVGLYATGEKQIKIALRTAQAAIGVEIPRLLISDLEFQQPEVGNLAAHLQFPRISISVKNYGRTPAFLGQQSSELLVAPFLPEIPVYPNAHDLESGRIIEGGASYDLPVARSRGMLSLETIESIIGGTTFVWVYGYIFYRDFLHDPHWLRFCAQLYVAAGNGPVRVLEEGPDKYTESY